ncbi:MAG: type II toxin-antitoxin system RelE/ParE family toxin [Elusimicrobia bacterium]|nr:type II toxin-antitoxin system RelE/ParE family toxin [Elusimicrobiota bacterium]
MTYRIAITPTALDMLRGVADARVRALIAKRIDGLALEPEKQGKALAGELAGLRSLRAAGQRFRVIYRVDKAVVTVTAVAVGLRREGDRGDVYRLAQKLVRLGLA